jgi:hypothetical protein
MIERLFACQLRGREVKDEVEWDACGDGEGAYMGDALGQIRWTAFVMNHCMSTVQAVVKDGHRAEQAQDRCMDRREPYTDLRVRRWLAADAYIIPRHSSCAYPLRLL